MDEQNPDQAGQFTRASRLLRKSGLKTDEANELTELISEMASANIISQFGGKIEALESTLRTELKAQKESQDAKYTILIWVIGASTVILSIVLTLLTVFGG